MTTPDYSHVPPHEVTKALRLCNLKILDQVLHRYAWQSPKRYNEIAHFVAKVRRLTEKKNEKDRLRNVGR
jgi:hypothetical protein